MCSCLVELWLEWLHDEISMALDGLDREHVYDLFEKAVKDYICKFPVGFWEAVWPCHPASVSAVVDCIERCYYPEKRVLV